MSVDMQVRIGRTFRGVFEQYREHHGKRFRCVGWKNHYTHPEEMDEEVGTLFLIILESGEEIEAWTEEIEEVNHGR